MSAHNAPDMLVAFQVGDYGIKSCIWSYSLPQIESSSTTILNTLIYIGVKKIIICPYQSRKMYNCSLYPQRKYIILCFESWVADWSWMWLLRNYFLYVSVSWIDELLKNYHHRLRFEFYLLMLICIKKVKKNFYL